MSEFRIYPLLEDFLRKRKWCGSTTQNLDMRGSIGLELDVMGLRKEKRGVKLFSIEAKENDFMQVLKQAITRTCYFDYCYIAFPYDGKSFEYVLNRIANNIDLLKKDSIGCLIVDTEKQKVYEVQPAWYQRGEKFHFREIIISKFKERSKERSRNQKEAGE